MPVVETVQTVRRSNAMVDGLGGRLGLMVQLEADIVEQLRLVELGQLNRCGGKPLCQIQKIIGIST